MAFIQAQKPDLVFLDINMPDLSGIQLLKSFTHRPLVIFTTAYSDFAVESYELNAVDYLLKPIEFDRFLKAVIKAQEMFESKLKQGQPLIESERLNNEAIFVKSGSKTFRVEPNNILFIEAMGNYVNFVLTDKKICVYMNMQEAFSLLPASKFCRIHKSYVIALNKMDTLEVFQVKIGNHTLPIGKTYRDKFFELIKKL